MREGRWVGIDEAGYGPNLGPLVMSYVSAVGPLDRPPDLWNDLSETVCRARECSRRLWIDDSKAVYAGRRGRCRLAAATLSALRTIGGSVPETFLELSRALGSGGLVETELDRWSPDTPALALIAEADAAFVTDALRIDHFGSAGWRLELLRSAILGPQRFNAILQGSRSKAEVHSAVFAELCAEIWGACADGLETVVQCDKHGGRHFYLDLLRRTLPGASVDQGEEGPTLSRSQVRGDDRRLTIEFRPKADRSCGFVALASILSKWPRECWMDQFNAFWQTRVPGLKPTAGYPVDARRFRREIESAAASEGIGPDLWWREK
jgi:hypothetical protein